MLGSGHLRPFRGNLSLRRPRRHNCGIFHQEGLPRIVDSEKWKAWDVRSESGRPSLFEVWEFG